MAMIVRATWLAAERAVFPFNRIYKQILVSDWLSPAMIYAQIGQCNWALEEGKCTLIFSYFKRISGWKLSYSSNFVIDTIKW